MQETRRDDTPTTAEPASVDAAEAQAASQKDAFDPETGEINWDCPCLGDMTKPPCGDAFKAAFSCFVYSKEEPKGIDCIEQFRAMQECFRQHPDIYSPDLTGEDDDDDEEEAEAKDLKETKQTKEE
ncbi:Oxidoreductase [Dinochytrium kinnereticum]|nr:Oxidoreductase [Dinochytrium kinnereticum]